MNDCETMTLKADLVREAFKRLNRHDARGASELWSEDALWRVPNGVISGRDAVVAYFREIFEGLPDVRLELVAIAERGDDVFAQWHLTGRQTGWFNSIAPTGKSVAIDGIDHLVVRDGKIVSNTVVFDQLTVARQIGTMPPPGSHAENLMKRAFNVRTRLLTRGN